MTRSSLTLAAGLLFTAAAVKLAFPSESKKAIETLVIPTAASIFAQQNDAVGASSAAAEPVTVTINAAEYFGEKQVVSREEALPESVEAAVETFLTEQEPYSALSLPADVTYSVELPSFPYVRPVNAATSSAFGYRVHPLENLTKFHYGTDLAALSGDDIVSFAEGTVTEVGEDPDSGRYIRIEHSDGYATKYAHCGLIFVHQGQRVSAGEKIALVGISGKVTGPHLHFELTKNGVYMNPEFFLAAI